MTTSNQATDLLAGVRLALVIGTTTYSEKSLPSLPSCADDANGISEVLADPNIGRFDVSTLIDRTAAEIRLSIVEFLAHRRVEDLIVLSLSGHGLRDRRGRLYFAATDTGEDQLAANGVEARFLIEQLDDCRARRQVLILDCCFSGTVLADTMGGGDLHKDLLSFGRGRAILTASRAAELAFVGRSPDGMAPAGSVFVAGLLDGLRTGNADENGDGYISVQEAYEYAFHHVRKIGAAQTPQHWLYEGDGKIWLARNPSSPKAIIPEQIPEALRTGLESPYPGVRLGAVTELIGWFTSGEAPRALAAQHELELIAQNDSPAVAAAARAALAQTPPPRPQLSIGPAGSLSDHRDWVRTVAFSPDSSMLASAGDDKTIRLWKLSGTHPPQRLVSRDWVRSVAFSNDGSLLASGGDDSTVQIWDTATQESLEVLTGHRRAVHTVKFSPDGSLLASAGRDATILLWDRAGGGRLPRDLTGHRDSVWEISFSPSGNLLASAAADAQVRLWDLTSGEMQEVPGHVGSVFSVAFNPEGNLFASAGEDRLIRIWDTTTCELVHVLGGHDRAINSVVFSPDGTLLASASDDASVQLWDPGNGQHIHTFEGHTGPVQCVAFSAVGVLASGGRDTSVKMWDLAPGEAP